MTHGGGLARVIIAAFVLLVPTSALAQTDQPVGPYALDIRGIFARHKQEPSVATDLGVTAPNLPGKSFGFMAGAHWYPLHTRLVALGIGGHLLRGKGSKTIEAAATPATTPATTPPVAGPTVVRHFRVLASEVSLNFGHRSGWSYISGGIGRSNLFVERQDQPVTDPPGRKTIHYGAGARWFTNHHLAVSLDLRWYAVAPQDASTTGGIAQPRTTLLVLSGGIALR